MRPTGWAHIRVTVPLEGWSSAAAAEVVGDGRTRLRIRREQARPAAPLRGALSYPGSWRAGRRSGEAVVSILPQWSWGYELHVAVSAPASIAGRVLWTRRRLQRMAQGLAVALRNTAERSARAAAVQTPKIKRRATSAGETTASLW